MTDIDATYIILPSDRICIAGHYYLTYCMLDYSKETPTPNGPILTECKLSRLLSPNLLKPKAEISFIMIKMSFPSVIFSNVFACILNPRRTDQSSLTNHHQQPYTTWYFNKFP